MKLSCIIDIYVSLNVKQVEYRKQPGLDLYNDLDSPLFGV